jgi:tRNA-dependent cyclodipeptide synthase
MSFDSVEVEAIERSATQAPSSLCRYRAKVSSCYPAKARDILSEEKSCFLGVSLENRSFSDGKFNEMIKWISRRAERCVVLVGDRIHRKTLQIRLGLSEDNALAAALELGRDFRERAAHLLQLSNNGCAYRIVLCSEIQSSDLYDKYFQVVRDRFSVCETFNETVRNFSGSYIDKRAQLDNAMTQEKQVMLSCEYFLEELAIFACLKKFGYPVMIYPGSFTTLQIIPRCLL